MKAFLLGLVLAALPATASAQTAGPDCRAGLEAFEKKPDLPQFRALIPCLSDADPRVRALAFDKLCHREVWDAPGFSELFPRLDALAAAGERDKDVAVSGKAQGFRWWLQNSRQWQQEKASAAAERIQATRTDLSDAVEKQRIRLSLLFGAGVVAQTLILVFGDGRPTVGRLFAAALAGLFGLMPGKHESHYEPHLHIAYCFIVYAFAIFWLYKDEIMARVSESNLLVNSLTLWYLCSAFLTGFDQRLVLAVAALPTIGTLIVAFTVREWSFPAKLACYVWFLVLTVANSIFQVRFGNLAFLFRDTFTPPNPLDLCMTGMAFTILAASLFYIYILIPLAGKHETQAQRMARWREDAHAMAGCFADYRLTAPQALQIIGLQLGFYAANHFVRFMMPGVAMNVSMVLLPLGFGLLYNKRQAPAAAAAPVPAA